MKRRNRPNVIVLQSDTYRPDFIAANGHPWVRTPGLDEWLGKTITFDNAMVASFPTIPMRTDCFTGIFSHLRHGWKPLDPAYVTLPAVLGKSGYSTQLIADTPHLMNMLFWRPFQHFRFLRGHEGDVALTRLNDPVELVVKDRRKTRVEKGRRRESPALVDRHAHTNFRQRYEAESHCALLSDVVCGWLEDNYRAGPFFLWADFFDVHEPWFPPRYLLDLYHPGYAGPAMPHPNYDSSRVFSKAELDDMRARYAGMCSLMDKSAGRIFRLIEDMGLLDNTVVVFISDHGTYIGEHGRTGKSLINPGIQDGFPFYREVANICWSMHVPGALGLKTRRPGSRLKPVVQPPDLMPTILDLCGVDVPDGTRVEGSSLVPLLTGRTNRGPRGVSITTGHHAGGVRKPTVTDGAWALVIGEPPDPVPPELYDVRRDPFQRRNVIKRHRREAVRLHGEMVAWLAMHGAGDGSLERLSPGNVGLA
jgi:arylsulfatase A-like enzyme